MRMVCNRACEERSDWTTKGRGVCGYASVASKAGEVLDVALMLWLELIAFAVTMPPTPMHSIRAHPSPADIGLPARHGTSLLTGTSSGSSAAQLTGSVCTSATAVTTAVFISVRSLGRGGEGVQGWVELQCCFIGNRL